MNSLEEEEVAPPGKQGEQSTSQIYANQKTAEGDVTRFPSTTGGLYNSSNSEKQEGVVQKEQQQDEENRSNQSYYSYYEESEDNEGKSQHHSIHEYEQLTISQPNGLRIIGTLKEAKNQRYKNES